MRIFKKREKVLVCVALEKEVSTDFARKLKNLIPDKEVEVLYTGLGQLNAALTLSRRLQKGSNLSVINVGTCGAVDLDYGETLRVTDVRCGHEKAFNSFYPTIILKEEPDFNKRVSLYTSDYFVNKSTKPNLYKSCRIFDMECYALARVCALNGVKFAAYKVVSDNLKVSITIPEWGNRTERLEQQLQNCIVSAISQSVHLPVLVTTYSNFV